MTCNLAKRIEREPVIDLGRWLVTVADLDEFSRRLKKPRPVVVKLAWGSWLA